MFNIFKRKSPILKYQEAKQEFEVFDAMFSRMSSLSDYQMDKWGKLKLEMEKQK